MPYASRKKQTEFVKNWYKNRRDTYLKGKCCVKCGSISSLEIDHIKPLKQKKRSSVWQLSKNKLAEELLKCQVLCRSCHIEKSKKDMLNMFPLVHGTANGYRHRGCRCDSCRQAHNAKCRATYHKRRTLNRQHEADI